MRPAPDGVASCGTFDCGADPYDVPIHIHADPDPSVSNCIVSACSVSIVAANVYDHTCLDCGATHRHAYAAVADPDA